MTVQLAKDRDGASIQAVALSGTTEVISSVTGSSTSSAAFSGQTLIRVATTVAVYIDIGQSPTASSSTAYMPPDSVEYFKISPGDSVAVRSVTDAGNVHVTVCA